MVVGDWGVCVRETGVSVYFKFNVNDHLQNRSHIDADLHYISISPPCSRRDKPSIRCVYPLPTYISPLAFKISK